MRLLKLTLSRERLDELTTDELRSVAGGQSQPGATCTCPDYTYYCLTGPALCDSRILCT